MVSVLTWRMVGRSERKTLTLTGRRAIVSGAPAVLEARTGAPKRASRHQLPAACRDSNPSQSHVVEREKSVERQVEHARAYAAAKGWRVADEHVYVDDAMSGAEFATRPGFLRLMNALKRKGGPGFDVLVMSEESRLGREQLEVGYSLKLIIQAGARVFFYLEDRERTLDTPIDKIMLSLTTFADELERERARQRTYDAMVRKARAGHVTGGRLFGYDNLTIYDEAGVRSHVERRINKAEAAVVVRIFELAAEGWGKRRIAVRLNVEGAVSPKPQRGRPAGWSPSSLFEVLKRPIYRGEIVWNQSKKRDRWGQHHQKDRPTAEWLRIPAPDLRIVSDELWAAAQARLQESRQKYLQATGGSTWGRPAGHRESRYLLTGLAECGACKASMVLLSREHGRHRAFRYGCSTHYRRGAVICGNHLELPMADADALVVDGVHDELLCSNAMDQVLDAAIEEIERTLQSDGGERLVKELANVTAEIGRYTRAVGVGGELRGLLEALKAAEDRRELLERQLREIDARRRKSLPERRALRRLLEVRVGEWRNLLHSNVVTARETLSQVLDGRVEFMPKIGLDVPCYEVTGKLNTGRVLRGILLPHWVASPAGSAPDGMVFSRLFRAA
jgi:site-specific DNA recombinase